MNSNCYMNRVPDKELNKYMQPIYISKKSPDYETMIDMVISLCKSYNIYYEIVEDPKEDFEGIEISFGRIERK